MAAPMVFDGLAKALQRSRIPHRVNDWQKAFFLKAETANRLVDRVLDVKRGHYPHILNLSSDGGMLAGALPDDLYSHLTMADTSPGLLRATMERLKLPKLEACYANSEDRLELPPASFDLALSNLTLHWANDLGGVFGHLRYLLRADCPLLGCLLGGDTLYELRCSLQQAEQEVAGGMAMRTSPMTDASTVADALFAAGFKMVTVDTDEIVVGYPNLMDLMHSLQAMGESNAATAR